MLGSEPLRVLLAGTTNPLRESLRQAGHRVAVGMETATALSVARQTELDVVVIDQDRVFADPFTLAKNIRAASLWRKPFFVLLAKENSDSQEAECREAGFDLLLFKPFAGELLLGFLERLKSVVDECQAFDPMI